MTPAHSSALLRTPASGLTVVSPCTRSSSTRKREDEELKCREAERRGQELEAQIKNLVEQESNKCLTLTENVKQLEVTNRELREQMKANENRMKEYENKIAIAESNQEEFKSLKTKEMVKERKARKVEEEKLKKASTSSGTTVVPLRCTDTPVRMYNQ